MSFYNNQIQNRINKCHNYHQIDFCEAEGEAEAFIQLLGRTADIWQPITGNSYQFPSWIFRGQGDANLQLIPKALREDKYNKNPYDQFNYEATKLKDFHKICQVYGLKIAEDSQNLHALDYSNIYSYKNEKPWPPIQLFSLCAHAQHYGVPTRLLDWSWDPLIAMYFAASSAIKKLKKSDFDGRIAIWALDTEQLNNNSLKKIQLVTAPTAEIPYLAAQKGVFTLVEDYYDEKNDTRTNPLDEIIVSHNPTEKESTSQLIKATLPYSQVKRLFYLLSREFVTAASVFPGYEGVVKYMMEETEYYDIPDEISQLVSSEVPSSDIRF